MHRFTLIGWACVSALLCQAAAHAAVSVYLSPEELTARAPLIVEARVVDSRPGLDPVTGALHTYVTLAVEATHRGPNDLGEIVLREPGGAWGNVVHEVDAVPVYRRGERVLAYLEPGRDGTLRTVGMFFGKFRLDDDLARGPLQATRDLEGQGTILGRVARDESIPRSDLVALAATPPGGARGVPGWSARPTGTAWSGVRGRSA